MDISRDTGGGDREGYWPNETVLASQLDESSGRGSSKFLFVHETGDSAAQKHGNRSAIRSHVTATVKRRFREAHKTTRKGTRKIRPKNLSLGSQPHDSNCPASMTATIASRPSLTFSIPDGDVLASDTEDLHTVQQALPEATTAISINPSPSALAGDSLIPSIRKVNEPWKASISYCKACGMPLGLIQPDQSLDLAKRYSGTKSTTPSPVEILGAGRVDPFSCYPITLNGKGNELLDHLATYKIPGLFPNSKPTSGANPVSIAWLGACQRTPLLFHVLMFAGSIHLDIVRGSKFEWDSPAILSYKLLILRLISEIISEGNGPVRDEVILAIFILSCHDSMAHEITPRMEERRSPFSQPLKNLQFLNIYGSIQFVPQHIKAAQDIITLKGGIEQIQLAGVAECLAVEDIINSMNLASKPIFPPLQSRENYISAVRAWATSPSRKFVQKLGSKFWNLQDHGMTDTMLQLFDAMGSLTIAIDHYLKGKPDGLTLGEIARTRTGIQKRLLLLPPDEELGIMPLFSPCLYEPCRLTGLIFSIAVVYPVPKTYAMLRSLSLRLKASIEKSEISRSRSSEVQYVLLWILMLGGIAALDKAERPWFVSQLAALVRILEIDWDGVEEILESFLWLESACGSGGRLLWSEVMEYRDWTV